MDADRHFITPAQHMISAILFLRRSEELLSLSPVYVNRWRKKRPVYNRFIRGTEAALRSWLLTIISMPICLCKPFPCNVFSRNLCPSAQSAGTVARGKQMCVLKRDERCLFAREAQRTISAILCWRVVPAICKSISISISISICICYLY